jgi:hypothetical protein
MASSFVSDAIFAGLKAQFENAMIELVSRIAEGEGLNTDELCAKYLVSVMPAPREAKGKAKMTMTREAKVTVTDTEAVCSCLTAKGKPCSLKPLIGTTMCRIHTKKAEADGTVATGSATGPIKDPKPKAKAVAKKSKKAKKRSEEPPVHTHELDEEIHEDCELCQTHGCPLEPVEEDEEFERVKSPPRTLRERLSRIAAAEAYLDDDDDDDN